MKLWHLELLKDEDTGWDMMHGCVVRAETEQQAREIAGEGIRESDGGPGMWLAPERASCVEVTQEGGPGFICIDFCDG